MTPDEMKQALEDAGYTVAAPEPSGGLDVIARWADQNGYTFARKDTSMDGGGNGGNQLQGIAGLSQLLEVLNGPSQNANAGKTPLTEEKILGMTPTELNENWEQVREYIESEGGLHP